MTDENKESKISNQSVHKNAKPIETVNPMKATNSPQMPTRLEFSQDQTKDNDAQEDDSK